MARYAASIFRQTFYLKLLDEEIKYLSSFKAPSGIKNELHRLKDVYSKGLTNLTAYMPNQKQVFLSELANNEERISAIGTIMDKLAVIPEENLLHIEQVFNEALNVQYK